MKLIRPRSQEEVVSKTTKKEGEYLWKFWLRNSIKKKSNQKRRNKKL